LVAFTSIEETKLTSGLTWRVILALTAAIFLFIPVNIYSFFLTGIIQGSVTVFFVTILIAELSRLSGTNLTKQELLLMYYAAGWGGAAIPVYYYIIYRAYFVRSPFSWFYKIEGRPLVDFIPTWLAPPYNSPAYDLRTLFQPSFMIPLLVFSLWSIIYLLVDVSLASFSAALYVERLEYPFPFAMVDSSIVTFLGERKGAIKYFILAFIGGTVFGGVIYLPTLVGFPSLIPIPFFDLTWAIQEVLPGGILAILTAPSGYVTSMVMPFNIALWIFISSISVWTILNSLFVTTFTDIFPLWSQEYTKGMGLIATLNRSYIRVWFGPQLGFTFAALIYIVLIKARKALGAAFLELTSRKARARSYLLPASKSFILFLISSFAGVMFYHFLIPEIPLWLAMVYSLGLGFFTPITFTAILGESGYTPPAPSLWPAIVSLSSYTGFSAFVFAPPVGTSSPVFSQQVKAAYIVGAKPFDLIKIWVLGFVLAQISGLISMDFFWRVAPIPSSAYPYSIFNILGMALSDAMLSTRQMVINFNTVVIPLLILLIILFTGSLIDKKEAFFSGIGLIIGLYTSPAYGMAIFVGSLLSNWVIPRFFGGKERWRSVVGYVIAGELAGEGLVIMLGVTANLIFKSSWIWPW